MDRLPEREDRPRVWRVRSEAARGTERGRHDRARLGARLPRSQVRRRLARRSSTAGRLARCFLRRDPELRGHAGSGVRLAGESRHCEERSDEAIQVIEGVWLSPWIASHALAMTIDASI